MNKKLYVGGLPHHVTAQQLQKLFSAYGTAQEATVMIDRITDLSRGFGFVEMGSDSEAQEATEHLNGTLFEGRAIKVTRASPKLVRTLEVL